MAALACEASKADRLLPARTCHSVARHECQRSRKRRLLFGHRSRADLGAATLCATRHRIEIIPLSREIIIISLIGPPSPSSAPPPSRSYLSQLEKGVFLRA